MNGQLRKSFDYFLAHQRELVERYSGKFVVIHGEEVFGAYDDALEASKAAQSRYSLGEFLVQKVQPGTESFTQTYYSRVAVH